MDILFITNGSIGDVVISTGLLAHLRDGYPGARFTLVAGPAAAPVLTGLPGLERLIPLTKQKRSLHWWSLWKQTRGTKWGVIVDLRSSAIAYLLRAGKRYVFRKGDTALSKSQQLAALFGLAALPKPKLWVSEHGHKAGLRFIPECTSFLVLAPKSNAAFKDWPIERYAQLAGWLSRHPGLRDTSIAVLALAVQQPFIQPLLQAIPENRRIDLSGQTDLETACALLERATLFIGGDSGFFHIAAAFGTRSVGLYGPTNDTRYAPTGENVTLAKVRNFKPEEEEIKDDTIITRLTLEQVQAAVEQALATVTLPAAARPSQSPHR